jgi:hypothetical protein
MRIAGGERRHRRLRDRRRRRGVRAAGRIGRAAGAAAVDDEDAASSGLVHGRVPRVAGDEVGLDVPVVSVGAPRSARELERQLRVRRHAEPADRRVLRGREPGSAIVDLAQRREREREHDAVGADVEGSSAAAAEAAHVGAVASAAQADQRRTQGDGTGRQPGGQAVGDPVSAAVHLEALVRAAVERERPPRRLPQLSDHGERAAHADVDPVLGAVRLADQTAQLGAAPAGDARVDPVGDRHLVDLARTARRAGGPNVPLERRVDGGEVGARAGEGIPPAVEPVQVRAQSARRLGVRVVEVQAELAHERADGVVVGVDRLAALLDDLAVGEVAAQGARASADAVRRLVHRASDAVLGEPVGAHQTGDAGAHDHDPPGRGRGA